MPDPTPGELLLDIQQYFSDLNADRQQYRDWLGGTATGGPNNDGRYPLTDFTGNTYLVACPARLAIDNASGSIGTGLSGLGFVEGLGTGNAAANRTAWQALLAAGGTVIIPEGDWDFRFASAPTQGVASDLVMIGAGPKARLWLSAYTYFDLTSGSLAVSNTHFYAPAALANSTVIGLDSLTQNIDHLIVTDCWFTNVFVPARATAPTSLAGVSAFAIDTVRMNRNRVRCPNGLSRISASRGRIVQYDSNDIDCGAAGGGAAGYAGISHGLVVNNGSGLMPEEIGQRPSITNNVIRNIKPLSDPGSPGRYGIVSNCPNALISGNHVEKVWPHYGTARSETMFNGNGSTTTFSGTLANVITPDSLQIKLGSTVIADDLDHGWAKGSNAAPTTSTGRQKIALPNGTVIGWVDYNTRQWSVTFPTAPAAGTYTANYFSGSGVDNIEAIYSKGFGTTVSDNTIMDCGGRQGMIGLKGGGQTGYLVNSQWERGPASAYGASVEGNVLSNRVQTGVFSTSRAIWCQMDVASFEGNIIEGLTDRVLRLATQGEARQISWGGSNKIRNFHGQSLVTAKLPTQNLTINLDIDGLWYSGSLDIIFVDIEAAGGAAHKNLVIERATWTDRVASGKNIVIAALSLDSTSSADVAVERVNGQSPWRGILKSGAGTSATLRVGPYRAANLIATNLVVGSTLSNDKAIESTGGLILDAASYPDSGAGSGGTPFVQDTGGANTLVGVVTSPPVPVLFAGLTVNVAVSNNNTGPVTMNVNGLGAKPVIADGAALSGGVLRAGRMYTMIYDGTSWQVIGLPDIIDASIAGNPGYIVRRNTLKECWGSIGITSGGSVTFNLPTPHFGFLRTEIGALQASSGTPSLPVMQTAIVRDAESRPTGVTFYNPNSMFVSFDVRTIGT